MADGESLTSGDLLKIIAGSALLAGAGRLGLHAIQDGGSGEDDEDLSSDDTLYTAGIPVPVRMSPEQYARFQRMRAKTSSNWDPTLLTLGIAGGLGGGWMGVDKLIKMRNKAALKSRLAKLKSELRALTGSPAEDDDQEVPLKLAYAAKWLDAVSDMYVASGCSVEKSASSSWYPGNWARNTVDSIKDATLGTVVKWLGPVAALSLILGAVSQSKLRSSTPSEYDAKRGALLKSLRQMEMGQTPHYTPVPIVEKRKDKEDAREVDRLSPLSLGLGRSYTDSEEETEPEEKQAGEKSAALLPAIMALLAWTGADVGGEAAGDGVTSLIDVITGRKSSDMAIDSARSQYNSGIAGLQSTADRLGSLDQRFRDTLDKVE